MRSRAGQVRFRKQSHRHSIAFSRSQMLQMSFSIFSTSLPFLPPFTPVWSVQKPPPITTYNVDISDLLSRRHE